jgi:hypothetical protein
MPSVYTLEAIRSALTIPVAIGICWLGWYTYRRASPSRWIGYKNVTLPKTRNRAGALIGTGLFVAIYALLLAIFVGPKILRSIPGDQQLLRDIFIAVFGLIFAVGIGEIVVGYSLLRRRRH